MTVWLKIGFLLFPSFVFSQAVNTDSLRRLLAKDLPDSVQYRISNDLAVYYRAVNMDSALYYNDICIELARKNGQVLDEAFSIDEKGFVLYSQGKLGEALHTLHEATRISDDPVNEKKIWVSRGDRTKLINASAEQERLILLANINHHMGHLMGRMKKFEQQIAYYQKTIQLSQQATPKGGDNIFIGYPYMNIGRAYSNLQKLDSALFYENQALKTFSQSGQRRYLSNVYLYLYEIYYKKGQFDTALAQLRNGIEVAAETNNLGVLASLYSAMAQYHTENGIFDSSLYYSSKQLELVEKNATPNVAAAYWNVYESYRLANNKDSMLKYLLLATDANDSTNLALQKSVSEFQDLSFQEQQRLQELENERIESRNRNRIYGLLAGVLILLIVGLLLYRNNRNKQKANKILKKTLEELQSTQAQLIQSEKMASLGELTAGIAHEIQNPLNFVNNFAEVNSEMIGEIRQSYPGTTDETDASWNELSQNMEKIVFHGKRADSIVKNMLQHSRTGSGTKEPTDINGICEEYLRLAYHGLRARDNNFNATIETELDNQAGTIHVVKQDLGRVLLNLLNNAFFAVNQKALQARKSGNASYQPTVSLTTNRKLNKVEIIVKDNGNGIPPAIRDKIFQPFFTTKPPGQGTGLGLSLSYDIITRAHGGEIKMKSEEGEGTEFLIVLPV